MILIYFHSKLYVSNEHLKGKHTNIYAKDYIATKRTLLIMLSCSMLKHRLLFGVTANLSTKYSENTSSCAYWHALAIIYCVSSTPALFYGGKLSFLNTVTFMLHTCSKVKVHCTLQPTPNCCLQKIDLPNLVHYYRWPRVESRN